MAYKIMAADRVEETDKLRDQLYNQYLMLYNDAVQVGNSMVAKQILDSIAKIFLPNQPQTAIQINSDKENGVTINFGFSEQ